MRKLNIKQKKILKLLSINCRFTNKDIAKAVHLSEDAVAYQINNLITEKKLGNFNTQFVHLNLGYKSHHIWLKLKDKKAAKKLKDIPHVNSINSNLGKFDYQILTYTKTQKEFAETLSYIKKNLAPTNIEHSELKSIYKMFTNVIPQINVDVTIPNNKKKIEYELNTPNYALPIEGMKNKLDKVDKQIIKELIHNPRARFQDIHNETDIPMETIRYRIKKYVKTRLINNFGLIHNFEKYGLHLTYFLLKLKDVNKAKFSEFVANMPNIMYAAELEGEVNCILYVFSQEPQEMFETYSQVLDFLADKVISSDLLFFNKVEKYVQFPEKELKYRH
jgi:DNA-binding Lrp family transcriptional regulator